MNILLDTCTYIWLRTEPEKLSRKAKDLINNTDTKLFLSSVSVWEINIKAKLGKLQVQGDLDKLVNIEMFSDVLQPTVFTIDDARQINKIKLHHKDPFDLMLICQAINNKLTILSPDKYIKKYKLNVIW